MRHFLSHQVGKIGSGVSSRSVRPSMSSSIPGEKIARRLCLTVLIAGIVLVSSSWAQAPFLTSRNDNARDGANTNETLLTPANVSPNSFGHLFSTPVDYVVMAQPLFMPNVSIPGQGTHNVVYVATAADSVYAIDADTGAQLWYASMLYGGTTAGVQYLPCSYGGFKQQGIIGTPVIDPTTNTMYLVAKTVLNGTVRHHLHALDITTGNEQPGSPVQIAATVTSNAGTVATFNSYYEMNRPGLLLLNGAVYIGFGGNGCNGDDYGWVISYNAASLTQLGAFNTSPDYGLVSIWQAGSGLAADETGNIFVETAETGAHGYDVPSGGQTFCNSVLKLSSNLDLADYFTPWNVAYLEAHDFDLSSTGAVVLPDQEGGYPHEVVASGKQGIVYVLNRDNMGMFSASDSQVIQEFSLEPESTKDVQFGSPAYWNNTVYFAPNGSPVLAFPLSNGLLGTPVQNSLVLSGSHSPSISANGNSNGILWVISGHSVPQLFAFDAVSLRPLYRSGASGKRDTLPQVGHFAVQTVANGKVYVATLNSLEAYALLHVLTVSAGNNQTGTVGTALSAPIQIHVANPYTGQPDVGVSVAFTDNKSGGSFNPPSPIITDANGNASTTYTLPKKAGTYTLTFSGTGFSNATATVTATPAAAASIIAYGGSKQTGAAGSVLPHALVVEAQDIYKNGVSGVTINFIANKGVLTQASAITGANGMASTTLQLPTTVTTVTVTASSTGFKTLTFVAYSVAGSAANVSITGGNNQSAAAATQLPQALTVRVADQYGNPVSGVSVGFSDGGAGGIFSNSNPGVTGSNGTATQFYTLPAVPGALNISATVTGVASPAVFAETSY
jgi:PQQ-like domain